MITQGQSEHNSAPVTVWAVRSYRAGENTQILALADELQRRFGWRYDVKRLAYRRRGFLVNLARGVSRTGIDVSRSDPLCPPWPEIVVSAGLRNEPICRWIRDQSGGRTKLVFLGRTWIPPQLSDLTITTPQYRVPPHRNVVHNTLTLHGVTRRRIEAAAAAWRPRLSALPEPRIAVLLGGDSGPYVLGRGNAARLASEVDAMARQYGGSVLISSSARTPSVAIDVLEASLGTPHRLYRWQPDDADNPYLAYLGLAGRIVVTGDSVAMLSEAVATGKPVYIFDTASRDATVQSRVYRLAMRFAPWRWTRDVSLVHRQLIADGRACMLGAPPASSAPRGARSSTDMDRAVARIGSLVHGEDRREHLQR